MTDKRIAYSRGFGQSDNTPEQRTAADFAAFAAAILDDRATGKGEQWIAAAFAKAPNDQAHRDTPTKRRAIGKPHRCSACAKPRRFLALDVDHGLTAESFAALVQVGQQWNGLIYTTASHKPESPRCRIVIELDDPAPRAELIAATVAIRARIDAAMTEQGQPAPAWDASCDRPEQPLYLPVFASQDYRLQGQIACLAELLADPAARATRETARIEPSQRQAACDKIPVGRRGIAILSEAGKLVRKGHRRDTLSAWLHRMNVMDCETPLPDAEVDDLLQRALGYGSSGFRIFTDRLFDDMADAVESGQASLATCFIVLTALRRYTPANNRHIVLTHDVCRFIPGCADETAFYHKRKQAVELGFLIAVKDSRHTRNGNTAREYAFPAKYLRANPGKLQGLQNASPLIEITASKALSSGLKDSGFRKRAGQKRPNRKDEAA